MKQTRPIASENIPYPDSHGYAHTVVTSLVYLDT